MAVSFGIGAKGVFTGPEVRGRLNFIFYFVCSTKIADFPVLAHCCFKSKLTPTVLFSTETKVVFLAQLKNERCFDICNESTRKEKWKSNKMFS